MTIATGWTDVDVRPESAQRTGRIAALDVLPSLNGLRAISIGLVLLSHAALFSGWPVALIQGDLGVRIFFVISGFLITHLLLLERERSGAIHLGAFYLRRGFRILPVYFCFLFALWIFERQHISACEWATSLTFTKDFGCGHGWLDDHLWSLSIEEQFYLMWPVALIILSKRNVAALALAILIAGPIARAGYYLSHNPNRPYALMTNIDMLMYGCLLAIAIHMAPHLKKLATYRTSALRLAAASMILIPAWLQYKLLLAPINLPFGPSVQAMGTAILIFSVVYCEDGLVFKLINLRLVNQIGVLSYSIYIWQQPLLSHHIQAPLYLRFCMIAGVAVLSYYALERPLIEFRRRLTPGLKSRTSAVPEFKGDPT